MNGRNAPEKSTYGEAATRKICKGCYTRKRTKLEVGSTETTEKERSSAKTETPSELRTCRITSRTSSVLEGERKRYVCPSGQGRSDLSRFKP